MLINSRVSVDRYHKALSLLLELHSSVFIFKCFRLLG